MLKSFSAQTNPLGAINYKGTWDASANTPTLTSSVGTKGDYYVVSVAGSTTLNGISNWGVGDWAVFNGSVWQRVEGGADVNAVNLTVSGSTTLSGTVRAQTLTIGLGGQTSVATNTALGFEVLNSASLTGAGNVGVGYRALLSTTSGGSNTAVGRTTLQNNTTGANNNAIGLNALQLNTTGNSNVGIAINALQNTTTGSNNIGIGEAAIRNNITGSTNIGIGTEALLRFSASQNTALGYRALYGGDATPANNTGTNNIGIGYQAGDAITTGSTNIVIGHDIDVDSPTANNQINVGGVYFHDRLLYTERADPAAPAANQAVVYARDNGAGKTQLCVLFNTGAVQVLATEP